MIPETVYKYKPIVLSKEEENNGDIQFDTTKIKYILDIIQEHRLYCASLENLNDPFEASHLTIYGDGVAGASLFASNGIIPPHTYKRFAKYRVLSLTVDAKSHLMWALYANNYFGVCIGFNTNCSLNRIRKINYFNEDDGNTSCWANDPLLEDKIIDTFYKKLKCWENELEYRIVQQDQYLYFKQDEIKHLIIGYNVPEIYKKELTKICRKQNIPVFIAMPNKIKRQIFIMNIDYKPNYDGTEIESDL